MTIQRAVRGIRDSIAGNTVLGRLGSGVGPAQPIAVSDLLSPSAILQALQGGMALVLSKLMDAQFGSTQGMILYRDSAAWKALAPGTAGQVLETQGAGANPAWTTVSSGASYGPLVNGDLPGPALVADPDGQCVMVSI